MFWKANTQSLTCPLTVHVSLILLVAGLSTEVTSYSTCSNVQCTGTHTLYMCVQVPICRNQSSTCLSMYGICLPPIHPPEDKQHTVWNVEC